MAIEIPKLILQPLVENSILHGFQEEHRGEIWIKAQVDGDVVVINVEDNGVGMAKQEVERINRMIQDSERDGIQSDKQGGFALKNLCRRCRLHYGFGFQAWVQANEKGTIIVLKLPRQDHFIPEGELK